MDEQHNSQQQSTPLGSTECIKQYARSKPLMIAQYWKQRMSQRQVLKGTPVTDTEIVHNKIDDVVAGLVIDMNTNSVHTGILDIDIREWVQAYDKANTRMK